MPGQQNRTANSWGRRRVLERESRAEPSERANERLMPPSRAESVATVGAACRRTRAHYVRHRYSVSCPLLPPWLPPTFTIAPPASTLSQWQQIRSPSPTVPRPDRRPPPPLPSSVAAVARAPVIGLATTSCVCPTLLLPIYVHICRHVRAYNPVPSPSDVALASYYYRRRRVSTENKIGASTASLRVASAGQRQSR